LDPSTLSVEHFSKETLMDALTLRRIAFDSRVEAQALFNLLEQLAIKTFPQPSITTVHDRNHPSHEKSVSAGGGDRRSNDADAITTSILTTTTTMTTFASLRHENGDVVITMTCVTPATAGFASHPASTKSGYAPQPSSRNVGLDLTTPTTWSQFRLATYLEVT
jgi:hypothetical protein